MEHKRERELKEIPVAVIRPNPQQPRQFFDETALRELAASIAADGLIQPIEVEADGEGGYILHHGERRLRAVTSLGWPTIEALVAPAMGEQQRRIHGLLENVQRQDMRPLEVARAYQALIDAGMSRLAIARRLGKAPETIGTYLQLLELPAAVQTAVDAGQLPADRRVSAGLLSVPESDREGLALKLAEGQATIAGVVKAVAVYHDLKERQQRKDLPATNGRQSRADCGQPRSGLSNLVRVVWGNCPRPVSEVYDLAEKVCRGCVFAGQSPTLACEQCQLVSFVQLYVNRGT